MQEAEAMAYFGWRKDQSFKPRHDGSGRRLTPAELANAAAAMGLPVSSTRYQSETTEGRNKRAVAYQEAVTMEAKARPAFAPKHLRSKRPPKRNK
jgi:hypothetical protein